MAIMRSLSGVADYGSGAHSISMRTTFKLTIAPVLNSGAPVRDRLFPGRRALQSYSAELSLTRLIRFSEKQIKYFASRHTGDYGEVGQDT